MAQRKPKAKSLEIRWPVVAQQAIEIARLIHVQYYHRQRRDYPQYPAGQGPMEVPKPDLPYVVRVYARQTKSDRPDDCVRDSSWWWEFLTTNEIVVVEVFFPKPNRQPEEEIWRYAITLVKTEDGKAPWQWKLLRVDFQYPLMPFSGGGKRWEGKSLFEMFVEGRGILGIGELAVEFLEAIPPQPELGLRKLRYRFPNGDVVEIREEYAWVRKGSRQSGETTYEEWEEFCRRAYYPAEGCFRWQQVEGYPRRNYRSGLVSGEPSIPEVQARLDRLWEASPHVSQLPMVKVRGDDACGPVRNAAGILVAAGKVRQASALLKLLGF